jgi:hypothetical protein
MSDTTSDINDLIADHVKRGLPDVYLPPGRIEFTISMIVPSGVQLIGDDGNPKRKQFSKKPALLCYRGGETE